MSSCSFSNAKKLCTRNARKTSRRENDSIIPWPPHNVCIFSVLPLTYLLLMKVGSQTYMPIRTSRRPLGSARAHKRPLCSHLRGPPASIRYITHVPSAHQKTERNRRAQAIRGSATLPHVTGLKWSAIFHCRIYARSRIQSFVHSIQESSYRA